ncbi:hypothetical protein EPI10_019265 [Gossypium australe]|uniref:Uncharacterized protein n=1 Tax=Gossypium australe TaxID=47621 RepID=A0A5B6WBU4_9ROSI|nr:hypothetical protein EPI10_019265 [Gossypium australe]
MPLPPNPLQHSASVKDSDGAPPSAPVHAQSSMAALRKLRFEEFKNTSITMQLADGSLVHLKSVLEDLSVKVQRTGHENEISGRTHVGMARRRRIVMDELTKRSK